MSKCKPTGFIAVCQCDRTVGALDARRTDNKEAGRILGQWLTNGCTVIPKFDGTWVAQIQMCQCEQEQTGGAA